MDLLYSRYSNPLEFMRLYIEQGRFGEFVSNIIEMDYKRKKEEFEKEDENKLWEMYVHSYPDKSFMDWKDEALRNQNKSEKYEQHVSKEEVVDIVNRSTDILDGFTLK